MELAMILISISFFILMTVLSIFLMQGKGGMLVAGYNMKAKGEKAKKCEKYFLYYIGIMLLGFGIFLSLYMILFILEFTITAIVFAIVGVVWLIAWLIILNTNKKIKRAVFLAKMLSKNPYYKDEFSNNDNF